MVIEHATLPSSSGSDISFDIRVQGIGSKPIVLILHGFKAFKDWGFFPFIAESLASSGAIAVTMNTSLNGYNADSNGAVCANERFTRNTISQELEDVRAVVSWIKAASSPILASQWNGEIYCVGHSRGAALALLLAAECSDVVRLALLAPVATFDRFTRRQKEQWRNDGTMQVQNQRTGELLTMDLAYLDDIEQHAEQYNLATAIGTLNIPCCILYAEQDITTPPRNAMELYQHSRTELTTLVGIPQCGHTFNAVHPFAGTTPALTLVLKQVYQHFAL